jgi:hypothetical protein
MQPADALDQVKRGEGEEDFVGPVASPDSGENLMRPAVEIQGTLDTAASLVTAADDRGANGPCCRRALTGKTINRALCQ